MTWKRLISELSSRKLVLTETQEVIFGGKIKKLSHPSLVFNNPNVLQASSHKHLGVTLDVKLAFGQHLKKVLNKVNKTICLLRKLVYYQGQH